MTADGIGGECLDLNRLGGVDGSLGDFSLRLTDCAGAAFVIVGNDEIDQPIPVVFVLDPHLTTYRSIARVTTVRRMYHVFHGRECEV